MMGACLVGGMGAHGWVLPAIGAISNSGSSRMPRAPNLHMATSLLITV